MRRWAVLVNPLLTKPPENNALCTAWILQGPFDVSTWLNWYMFDQGSQGVRSAFLDLWEYLAGKGALTDLISMTECTHGAGSILPCFRRYNNDRGTWSKQSPGTSSPAVTCCVVH